MAQVKGECSLVECPLRRTQAAPRIPNEIKDRLADAYAEQSRSDFTVYSVHLQRVEECHRLHFLQMACEKIAKAYRLRDTESFTEDDLYSHVVFSKFILGFLKARQLKERFRSRDAKRRHIERYARGLAASIERLAPAVDRDRTPENAEYPWVSGGAVFVPARHGFAVSRGLAERAGQEFLKLIETAIGDYETIRLTG